MTPSTFLLTLVALCFCFFINGGTADVQYRFNPDCKTTATQNCSDPWLIAVLNSPSANPNASTYHHLWGGVGAPTLITAKTSADAKLTINWDKFTTHAKDAIVIEPMPLNVFGVSITELILFDDPADTGSIANIPADQQQRLSMALFGWDYSIDATNGSRVSLSLFTTTFNGEEMDEKMRIIVKVTNTASEGREDQRPHLLAPAAAFTVDLVLDNLLLDNLLLDLNNTHPSPGPDRYHNHQRVARISEFKFPRFAVRLAIFSDEKRVPSGVQHTIDRSMDDEYAPGIFQLEQLTTPYARSSSSTPEGGYLQWRTVCYLTEKRDVNKATRPSLSAPPCNETTSAEEDLQSAGSWLGGRSFMERLSGGDDESEMSPLDVIDDSLKKSLAFAMFGDALRDKLVVETMVSFGDAEDGYYTAHNYTVWTFTQGSGSPPREGLSSTVLIVIIVGLGVPLLVLAVVGLVIKKLMTKKTPQHQRLLEEEQQA